MHSEMKSVNRSDKSEVNLSSVDSSTKDMEQSNPVVSVQNSNKMSSNMVKSPFGYQQDRQSSAKGILDLGYYKTLKVKKRKDDVMLKYLQRSEESN